MMRSMIAAVMVMTLLSSCKVLDDAPEETLPEYASVKITPEQDSLFMNEGNETRQLSVYGAIINVSERTISNSGVMTDIKYTVRTVDTTYQYVNPSSAKWYSSNAAIATVVNGLVTSKSPGYVQISAKVGNASSKPIVVNVRPVNKEPGLKINPPELVFILQNSTNVSGLVQQGAILSVTEPGSGFNNPSVLYNSDGTFDVNVAGLIQGPSTITVRAKNANDISLFTERSKSVLYYAPNTPSANAIVGNWLGTTLGKNFHFTIDNSIIPTRYDIAGTIDIDFKSLGLGLGLVQDINLLGVLNHNGTINVSLSKTTQGFTISGSLDGHFTSTGEGKGTYRAQAVRSGWPKISFNDVWTAVKVP